MRQNTAESRQEMLRTIQIALSAGAQAISHPGSEVMAEASPPLTSTPPIEELQVQFQSELEAAGGEFFRACSSREASQLIASLIQNHRSAPLIVSGDEIIQSLALREELKSILPDIQIISDPSERPGHVEVDERMTHSDWAITGADHLLADTGSVVLFSSPCRSRQISLLPAFHLVLAKSWQILPDFPALLERIIASADQGLLPSSITLITGPSRTADIEKILVKGVHGPQRLLVILLC
jgi:L-lactate dehydrogenase complex protein LldG